MGRSMAANILKAGSDLTVYDIRSEPMRELEKIGAKVGYKDIALVVTTGHDVGASLPITALASQLMAGLFLKED
jgi:3-hydroxyisobutyrate dehydrogenase-like beta-hydroxyacid dehydrogenase